MPSTLLLEEALNDLRSQERSQFNATAKKYDYWPSTLRRRCQGKTFSKAEAIDTYHAALPKAQKEALVGLINKLTDKGFPPTPRMVKNLAEEIRGQFVGQN